MPESEYAKKIKTAVKMVDKLIQDIVKDAINARNVLEELKRLGKKDGEK